MLPTTFTSIAAAVCFFTLSASRLSAQLQENFSDGELHHNPQWLGDTSQFRVNSSYILQSDGNGSDTLYISTAGPAITNNIQCHEIWLRLQFSPSENNHIRWYLYSSSADLESPLNGYYIRIGENGAGDCIRFYRQNGTQHQLLASGPAGTMSRNDNTVRIRVLYDPAGTFSLYADTLGNYVYSLQATWSDSIVTGQPYTGIWFRHSTSNATRFYADDLYAGPYLPDLSPPLVSGFEPGPAGQLKILFNEPLSGNSYTNLQNYILNNTSLPDSVKISVSGQELRLFFAPVWPQESNHSLWIGGLQDLAGNSMSDTLLSFTYAAPRPFNLVINEILADPNPPVGLPDCEFIELYNRMSYPVNLGAYRLQIGNNVVGLPSSLLAAHAYTLIFDESYLPYFPGLHTVPVAGFPAINNSGAPLILKDSSGMLIHEVHFKSSWYLDPVKDDGGFSLEQKNPDDLCSGQANWRASDFGTGGTPGFQNSIYSTTKQALSMDWIAEDSCHALLVFNKKSDPGSIQAEDFSIPGSPVQVSGINALSADSFRVSFSKVLEPGHEYRIHYSGSAFDCAGEPLPIPDTSYLRRYIPAFGDILITEIMADPEPQVQLPPYEYIELHNTLPFPVSLKNWTLQAGSSTLILGDYILPAGAYALTGPATYGNIPVIPFSGTFSGINNTYALIQLRSPDQELVHKAVYDINMFSEPLKKNGGWAQELQDRKHTCSDYGNRNGSRHPSGGTPGMINSLDTLTGTGPEPEAVYRGFSAPDTLLLYFSAPLHPGRVRKMQVVSGTGNITLKVFPDENDFSLVRVQTKNWSPSTTPETLRIDPVPGCESGTDSKSTIQVRQPSAKVLSGLKWNEILFDPPKDGKPYIEWYNGGSGPVELKNLYACLSDTAIPACNSGVQPVQTSLWLMPGELIAFCTDPGSLGPVYPCADLTHIRRCSKLTMPTLNGGTLGIFSASFEPGEQVYISADLHLPFLNSTDGVALERIQPAYPASEPSNWTSAAGSCHFGSPGAVNSQYMEHFAAEAELQTSVQVFSPDNDGYDDILGISCRLPRPGMLLTLRICDELGREVKTLGHNIPAGEQWQGSWDGSDNQGNKCRIGPYVLILQAFDQEGYTLKARRTVVLASRL